MLIKRGTPEPIQIIKTEQDPKEVQDKIESLKKEVENLDSQTDKKQDN